MMKIIRKAQYINKDSAIGHLSRLLRSHVNLAITISLFPLLILFSLCEIIHAAEGSILWSFQTGGMVRSSPAIGDDGTIYVGSYDKSLYAINPDGTKKWSFVTGDAIGENASPVISDDGKTIYIGSRDGKLYAIDSNGTLKWSFTTNAMVEATPALGKDGTIYFPSYVPFDGETVFYALNPDGTIKWTIGDGYLWGSPVIGYDGTIYVWQLKSYNDNKLYAISPDGAIKWVYNTTGGSGHIQPPAIDENGSIYVPLGNLFVVNQDGSKKVIIGGPVISVSLGPDGIIYGGNLNGDLYAFNPDGTKKWTYNPGGYADVWNTPAVGADGVIYTSYYNEPECKVYAINPDGKVRWSVSKGYDNANNSSPVISSNGTLYIGTDGGKLLAISTGSMGLANSNWPMFQANRKHSGRSDVLSLRVSKTGNGFGTVTSEPSGINCGNDCSEAFNQNKTSFTLTATPDSGSMFTGWTGGNCTGVGLCQVTITDKNTHVTASFAPDTIPPVGSIVINNGSAYTSSPSVSLDLSATDISGVAEMKFSNDNTTWSIAETYGMTKTWTLSSGDGLKTIYVKFKDNNGNWSNAVTAKITLDTMVPVTVTTPPAGAYNTAQNVSLMTTETAAIYYTTTGIDPTTDSTFYTGTIPITQTTILKYFAKDSAGNIETIKTATYIIDTVAPEGGSILINGDSKYTNSRYATLSLSATDLQDLAEMRFSNDGVEWTFPEPFSVIKPWVLSSGDGIKSIYVKLKDKAGNWSDPFYVSV